METYSTIQTWDETTGAWYNYHTFNTRDEAVEYANDPTTEVSAYRARIVTTITEEL
jgi:hypothetical protein